MTQEEIFDYNKRCAEFLKLEILPTSSNSLKYRYEGYEYYLHKLEFHSDWNLIMEVVEAIEKELDGSRPFKYGKLDSLEFNIMNNSIKIKASFWTNPNTVDGNYWSYFKYKKKYNKSSKKEAVVQAINQFLIWYDTKIN